eukprot:TRINITY_DN78677_c0_g1_i1.p1 TRINITY_DN78677_c0_g1~~TRINITY_DN78677_c0_g1_i1.p1  ORF type:complete len:331 (-),score=67.62 TRINITY_DN78677_c0_g1_i1:535-1386(-)
MDWKKSKDGSLSKEIQEQGLEVLKKLLAVCEEHSVPAAARCAIATEVFRKASNGSEYLQRVHSELGLSVEVLSQSDEAAIGFRTAVALQERPAKCVICWDSGGASFQITSLDPDFGDDAPLRSYVGCLGSGNTTALLVEAVQGKSFAECHSPNPVNSDQATELIQRLQQELPAPASWLNGSVVTAIGGPNSMFCVAKEALGQDEYDQASVRKALEGVLNKSDEDLSKEVFCQGELKEPPALIVPKICLLLAVMEHCSVQKVSFHPAIGSCPGLLISENCYTSK